MINANAYEIPIGATDYAYVAFREGEGPDNPEGTLRKIVKDSHHEVVGDIRRGPGWRPDEFYLWAYVKPSPGAAEAVAAHQAAAKGVA